MANDDGSLFPKLGMAQAPSRNSGSVDESQGQARDADLGRRARCSHEGGARAQLMSFERARKIADAVLYEGYLLYPYRASARKNQLRFQFGVLVPRAWSEAGGSEHWWMNTDCIVEAGENSRIAGTIRLQIQ